MESNIIECGFYIHDGCLATFTNVLSNPFVVMTQHIELAGDVVPMQGRAQQNKLRVEVQPWTPIPMYRKEDNAKPSMSKG